MDAGGCEEKGGRGREGGLWGGAHFWGLRWGGHPLPTATGAAAVGWVQGQAGAGGASSRGHQAGSWDSLAEGSLGQLAVLACLLACLSSRQLACLRRRAGRHSLYAGRLGDNFDAAASGASGSVGLEPGLLACVPPPLAGTTAEAPATRGVKARAPSPRFACASRGSDGGSDGGGSDGDGGGGGRCKSHCMQHTRLTEIACGKERGLGEDVGKGGGDLGAWGTCKAQAGRHMPGLHAAAASRLTWEVDVAHAAVALKLGAHLLRTAAHAGLGGGGAQWPCM